MKSPLLPAVALLLFGLCFAVKAQVVINEIHYHPVEQSFFDANVGTPGRTFDASGNPIFSDNGAAADFTDDVHEFIEIYNAGATTVDLSGWRFSSGIGYIFPNGTTIVAGGYKVIAKNVGRIQSVYGITGVLGPFSSSGSPAVQSKLSNDSDTVTLMNATNTVIDSVSYSARFPWAQSADALGVAKDWLGFDPIAYQYKGRSLQRVSVAANSNDPANWLASPLSPGPTPGAANAVSFATPRPVVVSFAAIQTSTGSPTIRLNQAVTVSATFSSTVSLSTVSVEYFNDNINSFAETRSTVSMTESPIGSGQYTASIPGQADRSVIRYRIRANRGAGVEVVSPRADDPAIVPVSASTKEAWHSYFVTPDRTSINPIYDCFISTADLNTLNGNIIGRVTGQGDPREIPYVLPTDPQWNGTKPAIVIYNGVVYDIMFRHHGSRYRRSAGRQSYKWQFPRTNLFQGTIQEIFETDKARDTGNHPNTEWGHQLFRAAGIPTSYTKRIDLYFNTNGVLQQLEQSVCDDRLLERYYEELYQRDKSVPKQTPGDVYKDKSTDEGGSSPFITFNGQQVTGNRTSGTGNIWTPLHQFRWSVSLQNNEWKGHKQFKDMIDGLWGARNTGNTNTIRTWCNTNWDMDKMLTYTALRNWGCPWDDHFHNWLIQRQSNGKWAMMPWDFDFEYADKSASTSIDVRNNSIKDTVITYFNTEYKNRMWLLNNTLLDPSNLVAMGIDFGSWANDRQSSVNSQLGLGAFQRPTKPVVLSPISNGGVTPPASLTASAYTHSSGNTTGNNAHTKSKWEIRSASGTYDSPVYAITSTTNLTAIPVPFADLTLGDAYAWRVTYYDALDHPSLTSDEASFVFGVGPVTQTLIAMDAATQWKYNPTFVTTLPFWSGTAFNDSAWLSGAAPLGHSPTAVLPVPIRTDFALGQQSGSPNYTYYFRKSFTFSGSVGPTTTLRLRQYVDDGVIFYLNGQELTRTRVTGSDQYQLLASSGVGDPAIEPAGGTFFTVPNTALVNGTNVLAVSVHQASNATAPHSLDMVFGVELQVTYTPAGGNLTINEVCADNRTIISNGAKNPDYFELLNRGGTPLDISGFTASDDPTVTGKYTFPPGTVIPANGYLVVWCDSDTGSPGLHTGFGLDSSGQSFAIYSNGALVDYVTFGVQATDLSIGRVPNGSGSFTAIVPSPGATNVAKALGSVANLRVNEWMANPTSGDDWFELYNTDSNPVLLSGLYLSDDVNALTNTKIPALSFISGKGFVKFVADGTTGGNHCNFKLATAGEYIVLTNTNGTSQLNSISFGNQAQGVSQGRLPDGAASFASFPQTPTPGASNYLLAPVVINEVLTNSTAPFEDAIEIYNPSAGSVNIGGWWLSDDKTAPQKFQIPPGTTIAAGAYKVFYENQFNAGVNAFSLSSSGDELILSAVDGGGALNGYRSQVSFGAAADNVSFGRLPTSGTPEFWPMISRTFGQDNAGDVATFRGGTGLPNSGPRTGPIIINEIMYHPADFAGDVDNARDEFVELHNITTSTVDMSGWKLKGDSDFTFPVGAVIRPGDYVVLVSFNPATDTASLTAFKNVYALNSSSVVFFGPYAPKLANGTQPVELAYPGPPVAGVTPYILVDKVEYFDNAPWPATADGTGQSLQRFSRTSIGNDPSNWGTASPSPGNVNYGQTVITDNDGDGLPNTWEDTYNLDKFSAADALLDADGDGLSNSAEYTAGTDPRSTASVLRAAVTKIAGGFNVHFTAMPNVSYSILYRNSFASGTWIKLTDVAATGGQHEVDVQDITAVTQRFYRVVTPQQ